MWRSAPCQPRRAAQNFPLTLHLFSRDALARLLARCYAADARRSTGGTVPSGPAARHPTPSVSYCAEETRRLVHADGAREEIIQSVRVYAPLALSILVGTATALAQEVIPSATLSPSFALRNVTRLTEQEGFMGALWSPSNQNHIAFTSTGYRGLFLLSLSTGEIRQLTTDRLSGFRFVWMADGEHILYRAKGDHSRAAIKAVELRNGALMRVSDESQHIGPPIETGPGTVSYRQEGRIETRSIGRRGVPSSQKPFAYQENDNIFIVQAGNTTQVTRGSGKFYLPGLSPDGTRVLYEEISSGIYVTDLRDGQTYPLGKGNHPRWSRNGKYVVFDVPEDDGHTLVASELFICRYDGSLRTKLTDTPQSIEQRPALSADGKRLVFDAGGALYAADLLLSEGQVQR